MRMRHILIYNDDGIKNPLNNIEDETSRQLEFSDYWTTLQLHCP